MMAGVTLCTANRDGRVGWCCGQALLLVVFFLTTTCSALTFDIESKVDPELWSDEHNAIWEEVIHRMGNMIQVRPENDDNTGIPLPLGGVCGPQQTEQLSTRHINNVTGHLVLPDPSSSVVIYLYTDRTPLLCTDPTLGIVAYAQM